MRVQMICLGKTFCLIPRETTLMAPSLLRQIRESELVVLFLSSLWLVVVLQYFIPLISLLPLALIPGVGPTW